MHMQHSDEEHGPPVVPVKFILEDPEGLTDTDTPEWSPAASPSMLAPTWVHVTLLSASATEHVAAVNVPKEHELVPDTVYPELHVG